MELAVVSGKGGTGKTTIAFAIAELEKDLVRIDADVDAPNLYLYYKGREIKKEAFYGSELAVVDHSKCVECGKCTEVCQFGAIDNGQIDETKCEGCGGCLVICPQKAVKMVDNKTADAYLTEVPGGIISRAKMGIGEDGSGKLITHIRKMAEKYSDNKKLTIIDGSPGIGCPVIASITGVDNVLIITEPTLTGMDDFIRISDLCDHFEISPLVCINKSDLNERVTKKIKGYCEDKNIKIVGEIPYDEKVNESVNELKSIIEYKESKASIAIRKMWDETKKNII